MNTTYTIKGMTCDGCARSISKVVQRACPGTKIEVSFTRGTAIIEGPHDADAVIAAVKAAGFKVIG